MIFVSTARVTNNPGDEYFRNQKFAVESWNKVAEAIVFFGPRQEHLASPITRFLPSEDFPKLVDVVDFCADQPVWCAIVNSDIWIHQALGKIEQKLNAKRAVAASSFRWNFDPAVGVNPCHHNDNGLDFFAAVPAAWAMLFEAMQHSPQGDIDSPKHLRLGAGQWDSWCLGAFFHLFSTMGFYNLTDACVVRHPIHGNRKYGTINHVPNYAPHFLGWPVMGQSILQ